MKKKSPGYIPEPEDAVGRVPNVLWVWGISPRKRIIPQQLLKIPSAKEPLLCKRKDQPTHKFTPLTKMHKYEKSLTYYQAFYEIST